MSKALATKNVAAVLLGVAMVFGFAFSFATPAKADTISDLQTQIQLLLAQIAALQTSGSSSSGAGCHVFTQNLKLGSSGGEVMWVQQFLNGHGAQVSASGAGSPGNETSYFGARTKAAVIAWQNAHAATVLAPVGLSAGTGNWGPSSRAAANAMCASNPNPPGPGPVIPSGPGISVSAGVQPANSLAPGGAARVPFTNFTLTNNSGAAVTINGITVQRTGLGSNSVFTGIVLVDSSSIQLGTSKTLNSNDQAVIGDSFTLNPGESKMLTVAGNMQPNATLASYAGQIISLSVVGINTSVAVSGSLPITGAQQTINSTLSIGSVSTSTSAFDPGSAQTKNIGDTAIKFSGVKFTAGSGEDLKFYSIRWRQVGSVSSTDLANLVTIVDGVSYPTTLDVAGKYYTTVFPGGLLIAKGFSKDVYIAGDIVGSNASSRTADFDIDKVTDVYFVGQTYGYGVAPSGTYTPWYNGYVFTISGASVTTIGKANEIPAQNVAVNVQNQTLGGFVVDLKGEAISVQSMVFSIATSSTGVGLLTNVSIFDENGAVVAGPVDASGAGTSLTFSDTVTFPTGRHIYTIKGKLPSGFTNNGTVILSSTPSSGWTSVTGQTTGNSITLSNGAFSMNTMTVKAAALAIAVSSTPSAQNIVAGAQGVLFANYQFDASQSGEDVRFSSLGLTASTSAALSSASLLTTCQLFDGTTPLNTGSNANNPTITATAFTATAVTFTLDNTVTVPKGTVKTLALKCDVNSSGTGSLRWGITSTQIGAIAVTGVTSSVSVTATGSTNNGQLQTIASGSFSVSTDASSPSYAIASAGTTGVTLGVYKFRATNESVNLQRIGLTLTNSASSSASDLVTVSLWANNAQIGTATFVGSNVNATSTLTSNITLTKDQDVIVTVKGDMADIGVSSPATAGHLIAVDVDTNSTNTQGTGVGSGATINATGSTSVAGVRLQKSYPTLAEESGSAALPTSGVADGKLMRFRITANSMGPVGIAKFTLTIATTTATVTGTNIYAFTDAGYSTPVTGINSDGALLATSLAGTAWASSATQLEYTAQTSAAASTTIQIPAGTTRYFEVRGSVSGATSGAAVITTLQGDGAYPGLSGFMSTFLLINNEVGTNNDFIWSPNSTTTVDTTGFDWTNGFGVVGLPSGGLVKTRSAN